MQIRPEKKKKTHKEAPRPGPEVGSVGGPTNTAVALLCLTNKWSRSPVTAAAPPRRSPSSSPAAETWTASLGGGGRDKDGVRRALCIRSHAPTVTSRRADIGIKKTFAV
ncbi:hypothetical protein EYF80_065557 [Liparis tanakae]|uniref:Uncharacterized protein n=1 Tax=Liparis tanakae TaxID=230148 RepID=A0A4Z2E6X2_9TELE|nr:hypothetical protein EYF80_065557 [Liparis tanakae]